MEARSKYSKVFDSDSVEWNTDREYNLMFLESMKRFMNDKLKAYGYVFLNEVYTHLGLPITKAGQIVGWRYDEKNPTGTTMLILVFTLTKKSQTKSIWILMLTEIFYNI